MAKPTEPAPGLLFAGLLWTDRQALSRALDAVTARFGRILLATPEESFDWPQYYEPEMGIGIMRRYFLLSRLVKRDELAAIKIATNAIEEDIRAASGGRGRPVNIDPGYLALENLILATAKPRSHRVYLRDGIYAESTLGFVSGRYEPWPWTYPDYARPVLSPFFLAGRKILQAMLRRAGMPSQGHHMEVERPSHALPSYPTFGEWARSRYGFPVRKVMVNAGFTCPNRDGTRGSGGCIYCDNAAFSPLLSGTVREQALRQLAAFKTPPKGVIVYFQPFTNTYGPLERLREAYFQALDVPGVVAVAVGTRPDCINEDVLCLLDELSNKVDVFLEIGVQSSNDETLKRMNRGHTYAETRAAFALVERGANANRLSCRIFTVAHLIIGLPGETESDIIETAHAVAALKPHGIKLHHLHVVRGTPLEEMHRRGEVPVLQEDEYVRLAAEVIRAFPKDTVLHRLMGETLGGALIAPRWVLSKKQVMERILFMVRA